MFNSEKIVNKILGKYEYIKISGISDKEYKKILRKLKQDRKLRKLSLKEIEKFIAKEGVRKIVVENFLLTVHNNPNELAAYINLDMDRKLYNWNAETIQAIKDGIWLSAGHNKD